MCETRLANRLVRHEDRRTSLQIFDSAAERNTSGDTLTCWPVLEMGMIAYPIIPISTGDEDALKERCRNRLIWPHADMPVTQSVLRQTTTGLIARYYDEIASQPEVAKACEVADEIPTPEFIFHPPNDMEGQHFLARHKQFLVWHHEALLAVTPSSHHTLIGR